MRVTYLKDAAGIKKGTEKELTDSKLALRLIDRGIVEETGAPKKKGKE